MEVSCTARSWYVATGIADLLLQPCVTGLGPCETNGGAGRDP